MSNIIASINGIQKLINAIAFHALSNVLPLSPLAKKLE